MECVWKIEASGESEAGAIENRGWFFAFALVPVRFFISFLNKSHELSIKSTAGKDNIHTWSSRLAGTPV